MPAIKPAKEYDARPDAKQRIRLRTVNASSFRVVHRPDGSILLKPLQVVEKVEYAETEESMRNRQKRLQKVVKTALANGEKIPAGVEHLATRRMTVAERELGKHFAGQAEKISHGKVGLWLRAAKGSVRQTDGKSADDLRMEYHTSKRGL